MAAPNTPVLDPLVQQIGQLCRECSVVKIVIVAKDPQTGEARVFGAKETMEELRDLVGEKFGFYSETSWEER